EVRDDGADRHAQHHIGAGGAELVRSPADLAMTGFVAPGIAEVDQRVEVGIGHRDHAAAAATVTPIGAAQWDELLAPETGTPRATVAGCNVDHRLVDELHGDLVVWQNKKAPACRGLDLLGTRA